MINNQRVFKKRADTHCSTHGGPTSKLQEISRCSNLPAFQAKKISNPKKIVKETWFNPQLPNYPLVI
jgi:hypothetical protein